MTASAPKIRQFLRVCQLALLALVAAATFAACQDRITEETELFELAERHYAHGDYDTAVTLYERFLVEHPLSPLADISRQRIRTIEREWDGVMGRRNAPPPVHFNPLGPANQPTSEDDFDREIVAPHLPALGE